MTNALKNKTAYPYAGVHHVRRHIRDEIQAHDANNKILATILVANPYTITSILGQLALQRLDLGSQCLHLLSLRRNGLGLLRDQVLDLLHLALDGAGGQGGLAGGG